MLEFVEWVILALQCLLLFHVTNVATVLEEADKRRDACESADGAVCHRHWVIHVVRDTDAHCTPCVVVLRSGHLVEMDTAVHDALLAASGSHDIDALMAGLPLHDAEDTDRPIMQIQYTRAVHDCTQREQMQQVLDRHKCDLVPIDHDAPPPYLVLQNAHAVLGIMLARHATISPSSPACGSKRPETSPRRTPNRCRSSTSTSNSSGEASASTTPPSKT